jgi:glutamyl-tRNA synthetase
MVKTRFAPSPTGWLHIGGARTALFSWLYARHCGGEFLLRIEDTDRERSKKEYEVEILESMKWLGLDWDGLEYQSQRFDVYRGEAERLIAEGKAYKKDGAVFIPAEFDEIVIDDMIRGRIVYKELPKKEEVIIKSDGCATYNFACAVDDAQMGVTHVIRGEDHIPNTPKQILMYRALGYTVPQYAHLPMILAEAGGKMSKRHGATAVTEYREFGYINKALVNYLLLLGWSPGNDREVISLDEAKELFELKDINKSNARFSMKKLNWMNNEYIKRMSSEELRTLIVPLMNRKGIKEPDDTGYFLQVIDLFKARAAVLDELVERTGYCFSDEFGYDEEVEPVLKDPKPRELELLKERFAAIDQFNAASLEQALRTVAEELNVKPGILIHPVRTAVSGKKAGPGLFELLEVLGKKRVLTRMQRLMDYWRT